jgi:protein-tyrosine kinase
MGMNRNTPKRAESLIERAAQVYDFTGAIRAPVVGRDLPVRDLPEPAVSAATAVSLPAFIEPAREPAPEIRPAHPGHTALHPEAIPVERVSLAPTGAVVPVDRAMLADAGFIIPDAAPGPLAEEFRIVKRQLLLNASGATTGKPIANGRMILVCSAQPDDGKTFCAVNLALSLAAERDTEVLLVDADVAKPEILSTLGLAGGPGLMDALTDPSLDVEQLIIRTDIPKLSVLGAGRQTNNDTETLASARTKAVLEGLASANPARVVIFDSAPALAASPASVLALHVGQIVMVVRADRTTESELRDALAMIDGCAHVNLLLNGSSYFGSNHSFGSYYGRDK